MLGESQLNVYILGSGLTPRQRQRLQAQIQTALRALPRWSLALLQRRLEELRIRSLPLIVEPRMPDDPSGQVLGFGQVESRPAVRLMPRVHGDEVDWEQDRRYVVAKAVAYLAAPGSEDADFWSRWSAAVTGDELRAKARDAAEQWADATDGDLLIEMFAAYVRAPRHLRWAGMPAMKAFFEGWLAAN